MLKKIIACVLSAIMLVTAMCVVANADETKEKMMYDFEKFADNEELKDSNFNGWPVPLPKTAGVKITVKPISKNGVDGSKALTISDEGTEGSFIVLSDSAKLNNKKFPGVKYMMVWVDFTDVKFANLGFGVRVGGGLYGDSYTTKLLNKDGKTYYIQKDGKWEKKDFDPDKTDENDNTIKDLGEYKGYIALPIDTMGYVKEDDKGQRVAGTEKAFDPSVDGVECFYMYYQLADAKYNDKFFTIDNIGFVDKIDEGSATVTTDTNTTNSTGSKSSSTTNSTKSSSTTSSKTNTKTGDTGVAGLAVVGLLVSVVAVIASKKRK